MAVILALVWWRRHPRVSLLTLAAIGLSVLVMLGGNFILAWLPDYLYPNSVEHFDQFQFQQRLLLTQLILIIRNVLGAVAYALLLAAVFIDRSRKNRVQGLPTDTAPSADNVSLARS